MIRIALILLFSFSNQSCAIAGDQSTPEGTGDDRARLETSLWSLHDEYVTYLRSKSHTQPFKSKLAHIKVVGNQVRIEAIAKNDAQELKAELGQIGATRLSVHGLYVNCQLPIEKIDELATLHSLKFARPVVEITYK